LTSEQVPTKVETEAIAEAHRPGPQVKDQYICDRCGAPMIERSCKIVCLNCGHRFDCSDLNIYFD